MYCEAVRKWLAVNAAHAEQNQSGIERNDKAVILMNPFHQTVAQHTKHQNFCQIVCGNGDIAISRAICALADGDSNVCRKCQNR